MGSSGTIQAVVSYARAEGQGHATARQIANAVEELADMDAEKRRKHFDPRRADIVVAGAVILEALMRTLKLETVTAVDRGLREGVLLDLLNRRRTGEPDTSLAEAALALGRRCNFGEAHARDVTRLVLELFDQLAPLHQLPAATRPWLEAAAILHDIGHALNHQRHHKHTHYLILNADLPGLSDRERRLVACIARFHRRSPPESTHEALEGLNANELRIIRKCSTLLRLADSLDSSHNQPVVKLTAAVSGRKVIVTVKTRTPVDLELWNVSHETTLFREVFGKSLQINVQRQAEKRVSARS
jgi:exopolyphosphatase/guanosine-5'-triphosphate,3'-diphosphate pyrophosphatase